MCHSVLTSTNVHINLLLIPEERVCANKTLFPMHCITLCSVVQQEKHHILLDWPKADLSGSCLVENLFFSVNGEILPPSGERSAQRFDEEEFIINHGAIPSSPGHRVSVNERRGCRGQEMEEDDSLERDWKNKVFVTGFT